MIQIKKPKYEHDNYCACCRKPFDDSMEISFSNENYNDSILVVLCGKCRRELMEALSKAETNRPEIPDSWIPVTKKMPEEKDTMFAKYWGTDRWNKYMFRKRSDMVEVTVELDDGTRVTEASRTMDGKWAIEDEHGFVHKKVVAWHPMSEPWKGEQHGPNKS